MKNLKEVFFDMDEVLYNSMKNHVTPRIESFKKPDIDFPPEEAYLNETSTGNGTITRVYRKHKQRKANEKKR